MVSLDTSTSTTGTQTPPPPPSNGFLNRRRRRGNTIPSLHPPCTVVSYKECLRNHAASIGGHALDGCGEFIPSPEPNSLTCAACDCHRNFHRRDTQQFPNPTFISFYPNPSSSRNGDVKREIPKGKKRQRTKFTEEQKEKMLEFCQKLGWRMPNTENEGMVQEFCNSIGVSRGIFKVWMHNNKNRKRLLQFENNSTTALDEEKINGDCN